MGDPSAVAAYEFGGGGHSFDKQDVSAGFGESWRALDRRFIAMHGAGVGAPEDPQPCVLSCLGRRLDLVDRHLR